MRSPQPELSDEVIAFRGALLRLLDDHANEITNALIGALGDVNREREHVPAIREKIAALNAAAESVLAGSETPRGAETCEHDFGVNAFCRKCSAPHPDLHLPGDNHAEKEE